MKSSLEIKNKRCVVCNDFLLPHKFKFCSLECKAISLENKKIEKICEFCQKKFKTSVPKTRFCSLKCSSKKNSPKRKILLGKFAKARKKYSDLDQSDLWQWFWDYKNMILYAQFWNKEHPNDKMPVPKLPEDHEDIYRYYDWMFETQRFINYKSVTNNYYIPKK